MASTSAGVKMSLRPGFILTCVIAVFTGLAGFYGGQWWANYEAQKSLERTVLLISRSDQARTLFLLRGVLEDLRADQVKQGEVKLLRYAKLQVNSVMECRKSKECTFLAGQLIPTQAELNELAAMEERK